MKRIWIVVGSIVTVVVLGWSATQAVGLLAHEEVTETQSFPAADLTTLSVGNSNGSVEIDGDAEATEVTVVAEISHGLQRTRHSAEVRDGALVLRSSCPFFSTWCSVDYRVTVPARLLVSVSSDNGRVTVRDVDGDVDVNSDNGRVQLTRITGGIRVSTDNGRVIGVGLRAPSLVADSDNGRMELTFAAPPSSIVTSADNGHIEIVVPDTGDAYAVDAGSDNGSTDIGIRTDPAGSRTIHADTDNGDITVRYPSG